MRRHSCRGVPGLTSHHCFGGWDSRLGCLGIAAATRGGEGRLGQLDCARDAMPIDTDRLAQRPVCAPRPAAPGAAFCALEAQLGGRWQKRLHPEWMQPFREPFNASMNRRAGDRTRTGDVQLGKLAFYQLNYARRTKGRYSTPTLPLRSTIYLPAIATR